LQIYNLFLFLQYPKKYFKHILTLKINFLLQINNY